MPKDIRIGGDITCNLSCPSCRDSIIDKNNIDKNHNEKLSDLMYKNLFSEPTNKEIVLHLSTSGEIFASNLLLNFIRKIEKKEFPNLKLDIQTNGLLMPQRWERLGELSCAVYKITITIDASTKKTYEKLRRGGKWEQIIKSLEWVKNLKNKQDIELNMRMVVQLDNYEEIENFYIMCKKYCADVVEFVRINNWGSMSSQEFEKIDVFSPLHPKYNIAKNHLNMVKFKEDVLIFGDL
jgi:MoaA/NifB/PqqE/SkfB family radical SAM enzyme